MKYELTLINSRYMAINDEWQTVEVGTRYVFNDLDAVNNLIGYLIEGAQGKPVKVEIKGVEDEQ